MSTCLMGFIKKYYLSEKYWIVQVYIYHLKQKY